MSDIHCKDCKWWGLSTGRGDEYVTERPTGFKSCQLSLDMNGVDEPLHPYTLAYASSYEGACLYTSPEFGCVQGVNRDA